MPDEQRVSPQKTKKSPSARPLQSKGQMHVLATFNNTIVTVTDQAGNTLVSSSAGKCGFKGPKKATPYAAGIIVKAVADKAKEIGIREVEVFVKGVGAGRESAIRAIAAHGFLITMIKDITPMPHNGVRPKKPRRV